MANEKPTTKKVKGLSITAAAEKFRRCGYEFSRTPVEIPADKLKPEQIKALKTERMLTVVEKDIEVAIEA